MADRFLRIPDVPVDHKSTCMLVPIQAWKFAQNEIEIGCFWCNCQITDDKCYGFFLRPVRSNLKPYLLDLYVCVACEPAFRVKFDADNPPGTVR